MDMRTDLHQKLVAYLKRSKDKKVLFKEFCNKKHITKLSERATLKKVVLTSTTVSYTYVLIDGVTEMLITM